MWRHFPLDTERAKQGRPERPSAHQVSSRTTVSRGDDGGEDEVLRIQTVAIVPAVALVLILMTTAFVYAHRSPLELTTRRRGRMFRSRSARWVALDRAGRNSAVATIMLAATPGLGTRVLGKLRDLTRHDPPEASPGEPEAKRAEPPAARENPVPDPAVPSHRVPSERAVERPAEKERPAQAQRPETPQKRPRRRRGGVGPRRGTHPDARGSATYVPLGDDRIALILEHHDPAVQAVTCRVRDPEGRVWLTQEVSVLLPRRYGLVYPTDFEGASPLREGNFFVEWLRGDGPAEEPLATLEMNATEQDVGSAEVRRDRPDAGPRRAGRVRAAPARLEAVAADPEPDRVRRSNPADEELEILKAKLGKPSTPVGDRRANEVDTLKSKLVAGTRVAGQAAPGNGSETLGTSEAANCRIAWRRGRTTSFFSAVAATAAGEQVIARSPRFHGTDAVLRSDDARARQAHRILLESLERAGWSVSGRGDQWYMLELRRRSRDVPQRRPDSER